MKLRWQVTSCPSPRCDGLYQNLEEDQGLRSQANEGRSRETVRDLVKRLSGIYRNRCPVNPKSAANDVVSDVS